MSPLDIANLMSAGIVIFLMFFFFVIRIVISYVVAKELQGRQKRSSFLRIFCFSVFLSPIVAALIFGPFEK